MHIRIYGYSLGPASYNFNKLTYNNDRVLIKVQSDKKKSSQLLLYSFHDELSHGMPLCELAQKYSKGKIEKGK